MRDGKPVPPFPVSPLPSLFYTFPLPLFSLFHIHSSLSPHPSRFAEPANTNPVAQAHVRALTVQEASNKRFICAAGPYSGQDYCDILHKHFDDLENIPVGKPGTHDEIVKGLNRFDGGLATKVLGIQYQSLEDCCVEMCKSLRARYKF